MYYCCIKSGAIKWAGNLVSVSLWAGKQLLNGPTNALHPNGSWEHHDSSRSYQNGHNSRRPHPPPPLPWIKPSPPDLAWLIVERYPSRHFWKECHNARPLLCVARTVVSFQDHNKCNSLDNTWAVLSMGFLILFAILYPKTQFSFTIDKSVCDRASQSNVFFATFSTLWVKRMIVDPPMVGWSMNDE
jgi:hypothetical protein